MKIQSVVLWKVVLAIIAANAFGQDSLNASKYAYLQLPGTASSVSLIGNLAVTAGDSIRIIDVSNLPSFTLLGHGAIQGWTHDLDVKDSFAFVAGSNGNLQVFDIRDPLFPSAIGYFDTPGESYRISIVDTILFIADGQSGIRAINISNPLQLVEVGALDLPLFSSVSGVSIAADKAYLVDSNGGLFCVDISNINQLVLLGYVQENERSFKDIVVRDSIAFVSDYFGRLRAFNISDPLSMHEFGNTQVTYWFQNLALCGNLVVASADNGIRAIDVSLPRFPTEVAYFNTLQVVGGYALDAAVRGDSIFAVDDNFGFGVYIFDPKGIFIVHPNGTEQLKVWTPNEVTWLDLDSVYSSVRIELNRHFPIGDWEVVADSTENDGRYDWTATYPVSDSCRVRIYALGEADTASIHLSENFSIAPSYGHLGFVSSNQQNNPFYSWDIGIIECPQFGSDQWFRIKNFGSEPIVVNQLIEPASAEFTTMTLCQFPLLLLPNEISPCSVQVVFDTVGEGSYYDTLYFQCNAANCPNGEITIPLSGSQIRTPEAPEVVLSTVGNNSVLRWDPVTQSAGHCDIDPPVYLVFFSEDPDGPFWFHGGTTDTTYTHVLAVQYTSEMFYHVYAVESDPVLLTLMADTEDSKGLAEPLVLSMVRQRRRQ